MKKGLRRIRVGILGCGQIAQAAHLDACTKGYNTSLHAICDVAPDLLARVAAKYQPKCTYTDYEQMLADPLVEIVIVAVADSFHVEAARKAVAAGKHVLVEKPLGVSVEECEQLAEAARHSPVKVHVGNMKRFDPGIAFAKHFLTSNGGEILHLKAWYCDSVYRYTQTDNLQPTIIRSEHSLRPSTDPKANKPAYFLLAHASHLLDTARFLGGPITGVKAELVTRSDTYCWTITAEFRRGFFGHLNMIIPARMDWHEGFEVQAEHGSVLCRTFNPWYFRSSEVVCHSAKHGVSYSPCGADAHFYKLQLEDLADTILNGTASPAATIEDGIATVRALVAVAESCRTRQFVPLDQVSGGVR